MSYIGSTNKTVSCLYGTFNIMEGKEVPMLFAVKFPQYVTVVKDEPVIETQVEEIQVVETVLTTDNNEYEEPKTKNERKLKQ